MLQSPGRSWGDDSVKRRLLGSVALPALLASPAFAADMPVKAPPPPPAVYSWTGSMSGSGFTGGGQVGYNFQNRNLVFGVELDVEAFNLKLSRQASARYPFSFLPGMAGSTFTVTSSLDTRWLFTARGRLGWAFDSVLVFATGGLAVTDLRASHTFSDNYAPPFGAGAWSGSTTKTGWTAGGGVEWAAGRKWTVKVEYLYLNFGSVGAAGTIINPSAVGYANGISTSVDLTAHIARAGINFQF